MRAFFTNFAVSTHLSESTNYSFQRLLEAYDLTPQEAGESLCTIHATGPGNYTMTSSSKDLSFEKFNDLGDKVSKFVHQQGNDSSNWQIGNESVADTTSSDTASSVANRIYSPITGEDITDTVMKNRAECAADTDPSATVIYAMDHNL